MADRVELRPLVDRFADPALQDGAAIDELLTQVPAVQRGTFAGRVRAALVALDERAQQDAERPRTGQVATLGDEDVPEARRVREMKRQLIRAW